MHVDIYVAIRESKKKNEKKPRSNESTYRHEALFIFPVNKERCLSPADKQSTFLCLAA